MNINKKIVFNSIVVLVTGCVFYTRFIHLGWGLPYPFHPDERNMADAIVALKCTTLDLDCFNPHFFAYGQLPLYLGYMLISIFHFVSHIKDIPITFAEASISLRIISAIASISTVFISTKICAVILEHYLAKKLLVVLSSLLFIFSPALIQFAHFGTTESLLMLFYTYLIYCSLCVLKRTYSLQKYMVMGGIICGLSLATKTSSIIYLVIPILLIVWTIMTSDAERKILLSFFTVIRFGAYVGILAILGSPHNFISFNAFLGSMQYESSVGLGKVLVFYTRQFQMTLPIEFQVRSIFPYALGWPVWILFILSMFFLPYKKEFNLLRLAFVVGFIPNAFIFTKWTRFVSLLFPLMTIMTALFLSQLYSSANRYFIRKDFKSPGFKIAKIILGLLFLCTLLPGVAFLSVYKDQDIRFTASQWIYNTIPNNSEILSETANAVDLPIQLSDEIANNVVPAKNYHIVSFNFYDLDLNSDLQTQLDEEVSRADYIIVPSRRIFANHTCLNNTTTSMFLLRTRCDYLTANYPILNEYYRKLFNGELGFTLEKEFSSYPHISILGHTLSFKDEMAEETWSVFDHPVIRIYKKQKKTAI